MKNRVLYFPFTHITQSAQETLLSYFDTFDCFDSKVEQQRPAASTDIEGETGVQRHSCDEQVMLAADRQYKQYLEWAKIHKGNERNLKSLLTDSPYFQDDSHVTAIKSQLKSTQVAGESQQKTNIEKDLLFLKMADECDRLNENIDQDLVSVDRAKTELITSLRGLDDSMPHEEQETIHSDSGAIMTGQRLSSWAACMSRSTTLQGGHPLIFVTDSQSVFDYLESNSETCVNALDIEEIKVHENGCENKKEWQQRMMEILFAAAQGERVLEEELPGTDDGCDKKGHLKVNLLTGNEINKHFNLSEKQTAVCLIKLK